MSLAKLMKAENDRLKTASENRGGFERVEWYKPQDGENLIRFLPHKKKPDELPPFLQVNLHFATFKRKDKLVQNAPIRCLQDFGEDCPACNAYKVMVKKDKDAARKLRAVERYLYNVIDYTGTPKVLPYAVGVQIHEIVMGNWNDIGEQMFDVEEGRDWKIVKKKVPGKPKGLDVSYAARPMPTPTAVPAKLRPLLKEMQDLSKLYSEKDEEALLQFAGFKAKAKSSDEDEEADDEFPEELSSSAKAKAAAAKAKARARDEEEDEEDEDEEPAPKKKASKKAVVEDEEDEEEDEAPKKKAKKSVDDDDDDGIPFHSPKVKKKAVVDEDDEEPAPKKKAKKVVEEDDEEPAPVKKKKKKVEDDDEDLEAELKGLGV